MKKFYVFLFLVFFAFFNSQAKYDLKTFSLKNGLNVVLIKKSTSPIVSFSVWYNCGSAHDKLSKSGVAHYLEHMAFCMNGGAFDHFLETIGAERNAFTSLRTICFYEITPVENIEEVIKNEAIRMESIQIDEEKFITEKGAILEERNMRIDSNPSGQQYEAVCANIFNRSIGGINTIGWKNEIESITPNDLIDFHNKWFSPNNATIIVAGDCDINYLRKLIEKYFGKIHPKKINKLSENNNRSSVIKDINFSSPKNGYSASMQYVFLIPFNVRSNPRKAIALNIASTIINQPTYFARTILEDTIKKAICISFDYLFSYYQQDMFSVTISSSSIYDLVDCEEIWSLYLKNKILSTKLKQSDLDLIKKKERIALAYRQDDISEMSTYFGFMLATGFTTEYIQQLDETIQSITLDECQSVLTEILENEHIAISRATPKGYDRE